MILHAFLVTDWDDDPANATPDEHDALGWFTADELGGPRLVDQTYPAWPPR